MENKTEIKKQKEIPTVTVTLKDGRNFLVKQDTYDSIMSRIYEKHSLSSDFGKLTVVLLIAITGYIQFKLGGGLEMTTRDNIIPWSLSFSTLQHSWTPLFSYLFVHAGWDHFGGNMFSLFLFGLPLARRQGPLGFLAIYFLGGFVGGIFHLVASGGQPIVGASGAVFAVTGASLLVAPKDKEGFPLQLVIGILAILAIPGPTSKLFYSDSISHAAHMAGTASGLLLFLVFVDAKYRDKYRTSAFALVLAIFLLLQIRLHGIKLIEQMYFHGFVLPWEPTGKWDSWLWVILGAGGVFAACRYIISVAEKIEAKKAKNRDTEFRNLIVDAGTELKDENVSSKKENSQDSRLDEHISQTESVYSNGNPSKGNEQHESDAQDISAPHTNELKDSSTTVCSDQSESLSEADEVDPLSKPQNIEEGGGSNRTAS